MAELEQANSQIQANASEIWKVNLRFVHASWHEMRALSAKRFGPGKMGGDPSYTISLDPLSLQTYWI